MPGDIFFEDGRNAGLQGLPSAGPFEQALVVLQNGIRCCEQDSDTGFGWRFIFL
jgi:hypothetical protein